MKRDNFNINILKKIIKKPPINTKASDFWTIPYVSDHVLQAHLNQKIEAGSRKKRLISAECEYIARMAEQGLKHKNKSKDEALILDLGCGPGLYAKKLSEKGFNIYGIDISPASIKYAKSSRISSAVFKAGDFIKIPYPENIDTAIMIYGIFGNLYDKDRNKVLKKLTKSMYSGSRFIFDVFSKEYAQKEALKETWYIAEKDGFWMEEPHLVLEKHWVYEKYKTILNAYYILDSQGNLHKNFVRHRWYDLNELSKIMKDHGFNIIDYSSDLTGSPYTDKSLWLGIIAEYKG